MRRVVLRTSWQNPVTPEIVEFFRRAVGQPLRTPAPKDLRWQKVEPLLDPQTAVAGDRALTLVLLQQVLYTSSGFLPSRGGAEMIEEKTLRQIADLHKYLGLSYVELGMMLGVTDQPGRTVWCWERSGHEDFGTDVFTPVHREKLEEAHAGFMRLRKIFVAKRLRSVIRRRAEAFDGERALDWILRGKITEVAERYERLLSYQS